MRDIYIVFSGNRGNPDNNKGESAKKIQALLMYNTLSQSDETDRHSVWVKRDTGLFMIKSSIVNMLNYYNSLLNEKVERNNPSVSKLKESYSSKKVAFGEEALKYFEKECPDYLVVKKYHDEIIKFNNGYISFITEQDYDEAKERFDCRNFLTARGRKR